MSATLCRQMSAQLLRRTHTNIHAASHRHNDALVIFPGWSSCADKASMFPQGEVKATEGKEKKKEKQRRKKGGNSGRRKKGQGPL